MKYFLLFFLALLCTGCQLFQGQQQAGESVATEAKQEEVFVPVEKELYVITHTAMEYAKPNILAQAKKELNSFGALFEIEAESEHFYKIKSVSDMYLRKEDMGSYEDIQFTKEALETVHVIGTKREERAFLNEKSNATLSEYFTVDLISYEEYQQALRSRYISLIENNPPIKKRKGILSLPCRDTLVQLKDIELTSEPRMGSYKYLGELPSINQYLVVGLYYDLVYKFLIDKRTGRKTEVENLPYLSPNGEYILTLGILENEGPTAITLYKVLSKDPLHIESVATAWIRYWVAYEGDSKNPIFFSEDGNLYASMDAISTYEDHLEKFKEERKYIRIKIK